MEWLATEVDDQSSLHCVAVSTGAMSHPTWHLISTDDFMKESLVCTVTLQQPHYRVSNRSAGMISSKFPVDSRSVKTPALAPWNSISSVNSMRSSSHCCHRKHVELLVLSFLALVPTLSFSTLVWTKYLSLQDMIFLFQSTFLRTSFISHHVITDLSTTVFQMLRYFPAAFWSRNVNKWISPILEPTTCKSQVSCPANSVTASSIASQAPS